MTADPLTIGDDWIKCPHCGQSVAPDQVAKCPSIYPPMADPEERLQADAQGFASTAFERGEQPHYPNNAELRAFRRNVYSQARAWDDPQHRAFLPPWEGGAYAEERRYGIGGAYDPWTYTNGPLSGQYVTYRRLANALRSEAYEAARQEIATDPLTEAEVSAFWDAVHTFAPTHDGPRYAKP